MGKFSAEPKMYLPTSKDSSKMPFYAHTLNYILIYISKKMLLCVLNGFCVISANKKICSKSTALKRSDSVEQAWSSFLPLMFGFHATTGPEATRKNVSRYLCDCTKKKACKIYVLTKATEDTRWQKLFFCFLKVVCILQSFTPGPQSWSDSYKRISQLLIATQ